eukprot:UN25994
MQLLAQEPDRLNGFVEFGGLKHISYFLTNNIFSQDFLAILAHQQFPFCFEQIETSGLGQLVYKLSKNEIKNPYTNEAKQVFEMWRMRNKTEVRKPRTRKIKFANPTRLINSVPFTQTESLNTFSKAVAKQKRINFKCTIN